MKWSKLWRLDGWRVGNYDFKKGTAQLYHDYNPTKPEKTIALPPLMIELIRRAKCDALDEAKMEQERRQTKIANAVSVLREAFDI